MVLGAAISGGAALAGGILGSNDDALKDAARAAEFRPVRINTGSGSIDFNRFGDNRTLDVALADPLEQARAGLFGGISGSNQFLPFGSDLDSALRSGQFNIGSLLSGLGVGGMPGAFSGFDQQLGINQLQDQGFLSRFLGETGQAQQLGLGTGFGANTLGLGMLGNSDFSQIADQQLQRLRSEALPDEQRFANQTINNLFNTGRLGAPGGAQALGRLQESQDKADLGRQGAAFDFANRLRQQNLQTGSGLLGIANSSVAGLGNLARQRADAGFLFGDRSLSRADQRLSNLQRQFGFGEDLRQRQSTGLLSQLLGLEGTLFDRERGLLDDSIRAGGAASAAGANAGQFLSQTGGSELGGLLGGVGEFALERILTSPNSTIGGLLS